MKSFFTKQLALLAMLLFAGVGSAFGNSKFTFSMNYPNADAVRLDFQTEEGSFQVWPLNNNEWVYEGEHDIVMSGVEVFNPLYSLKKLTVDRADVTETFKTGGNLSMSPTVDHTVNIELDKVETCKFNVTFSHQNVASVYLGTPIHYPSTSEDGYMEVRKGDNTWLHVYQQNSAYPIKKVTLDGEDITEYFTNGNDGYLIENVSTDHNINVELVELPSNTITVNSEAYNYGSVAFLNGSLYQYDNPAVLPKGQDIKMLINPNPGYRVSKVKVDGTDVTAAYNNANYSYQFTNLQADHTVYVEYEEVATHRIRVNDFDTEKGWMSIVSYWGDSGFSIFPNYEDGYYASSAGSNVRLEIYPNGAYPVKSLKVDNVDVTSQMTDGRSYEFLNLNQDHEVTVTFGDMVTVTPNYDRDLGEVYLNGIDWAPENEYQIGEGKTVRLIALPYDGCKISSIEVGGQDVTDEYLANDYYDFIANASTSVSVTFVEAERYGIAVYYDTNEGYIQLNNRDPLENPTFIEGSDVMLRIYPNTGYDVEAITVDEDQVSLSYDEENAYYYYNFENLSENHEVNVTFKEPGQTTMLLQFNNSQTDLFLNNSLYNNGGYYNFTKNANIRLKLQPHIGYEVKSIMLNEDDVTSDYIAIGGYLDFELDADMGYLTVTMKKKSDATEVTATIPEVGATTFCSEYDLDFNNVYGIKAYVVSGFNPDTNEALLTRVMNVPAGMGVVITGTPGNYTIPVAPTSYVYANMLCAVIEPTTIWQTDWLTAWYGNCDYANYLFDGESFNVVPEEGAEIEAYKAYMVIPTSVVGTTALAKVSIIFEDDYDEGLITGLGFISAGQQQKGKTSDAVYDLQGRKMNAESLKAGIYIRNGKKFIVK